MSDPHTCSVVVTLNAFFAADACLAGQNEFKMGYSYVSIGITNIIKIVAEDLHYVRLVRELNLFNKGGQFSMHSTRNTKTSKQLRANNYIGSQECQARTNQSCPAADLNNLTAASFRDRKLSMGKRDKPSCPPKNEIGRIPSRSSRP